MLKCSCSFPTLLAPANFYQISVISIFNWYRPLLPKGNSLQASFNFSNLPQAIFPSFYQIFVLTSLIFYIGSYAILNILRRKETEEEEFLPTSWEDAIVYKVTKMVILINKTRHLFSSQIYHLKTFFTIPFSTCIFTKSKLSQAP